jgi:hypothetical protein
MLAVLAIPARRYRGITGEAPSLTSGEIDGKKIPTERPIASGFLNVVKAEDIQ